MRAVRLQIEQIDNRSRKVLWVDFQEVSDLTTVKTIRYLLAKALEQFKEVGIKRIRN